MRRIAEKYPNDFEAQVYYALTLQSSAPKADVTYANQRKSTAMLEDLYKKAPQHPGITHYLIHGYDFAPFAGQGIAAARRYASIAPAVPHARHMPAHIYSMVGLWQDSITSNMSALEIQPDYYHAADFTVYAHLQLAQDETAAKMIATAVATPERGDRPPSMANYTAKAAMPARYVLERADWRAAAALPIVPTEYPQADSLTHFTRGLGLARLGNTRGAAAEIDAMNRLRVAMEKSGDAYWASRTEEQIQAVSAVAPPAARATRLWPRCARRPTARMRASSTWRWKIASTRCVSCLPSCCSNPAMRRTRSPSSSAHWRSSRTVIAASTEQPAPRKRWAIAPPPRSTTAR